MVSERARWFAWAVAILVVLGMTTSACAQTGSGTSDDAPEDNPAAQNQSAGSGNDSDDGDDASDDSGNQGDTDDGNRDEDDNGGDDADDDGGADDSGDDNGGARR